MSKSDHSNPRLSTRTASKSNPAEPNENNNHNTNNAFQTTPFNAPSLHFPPPRTPLHAIADPSLASSEALARGLSRRFSLSSAHTTPSKNASSRLSVAAAGVNYASSSGTRVLHGSAKVPRAISLPDTESSAKHFELEGDSSFWSDHNVQVLIRIRPPSAVERISQGHGRCLRQESGQSLVWLGHPEARFTFDHVACETITQECLFRVAGLPMVENCLSGYNSCMFAYGQTGSGKTYTMMGEIYEIEGKLNDDCGLTPRIFEYLFARIMAEEENRRDEQLKYSCKCSFLEIYNEQITDLLEPSSTNLQLREDLKKGVHVENLTEYNVRNANDVLNLLLQGAANRKVAATHMNSESSRSHSVLTCTIESRWGKDSMSHFRFARLNLVDLAGSERQKSSGAEGDRLKEAANINKSLSTLGLVIMSLVDLAHEKPRHVPYRDSRLTFLLQDSLGGNSKTTIIANVSPSICSANETLSTLKFAQRAKLIQNNAKVNEDASGDINSLQRQIQELKGQLSYLTKNAFCLRSPSYVPGFEESNFVDMPEEYGIKMKSGNDVIQHLQNKIKHMEATLVGALRREKMVEKELQKLKVELEQSNCLARQREEDAQHAKLMLTLREEEIKRLESLKDGVLSTETYLVQENEALLEEIQILHSGTNRNLGLNQLIVENSRLQEQLQQFQNFYEQGERELLLAEVSGLRNQILDMQEGKVTFSSNNGSQESYASKDLEDCRTMNSKLIREVDELRRVLGRNFVLSQTATDSVMDSFSKDSEVFRQVDEYSLLESRSMQSDAGDVMASYIQTKDEASRYLMDKNVDCVLSTSSNVSVEEFMDAKLLIESEETYNGKVDEKSEDIDRILLQAKLDRMTQDLEEVMLLNSQFQEKQESELSCQQEAELIREQVEMETARTILQLQEEVSSLQCNVDEKLSNMAHENAKLRKIIVTKDEEVTTLNMEWERATLELTGFLLDGCRSLRNMSGQIESISCSFPRTNVLISEPVARAAKTYLEKEETILQLKRSLEDAQCMVIDLGQKLSSLRQVTFAFTELQNLDDDEISKEDVTMLLGEKIDMVKKLEKKLKLNESQVMKLEKHASVAFILINWLFDRKDVAHGESGQQFMNSGCAVDTVSMEASKYQKFEDQYDMLHCLREGIKQANCSLEVIEDFLHTEANMFECTPSYRGQINGDSWSPDCSSSSSDFSNGSIASGKTCDASLAIEGPIISSCNQHSRSPSTYLRNARISGSTRSFLTMELEKLFNLFNMLHGRLATLVNELNSVHGSDLEDFKRSIPSSSSQANMGSRITQKEENTEKIEHATCFLKKFEEVHATVKEADFMLNALVEANENSKQLSGTWKRTGEELMLERASLIEEVERLKLSINEKETENQLLHVQASCSLQDVATSISLLEECYAQLKIDEGKLVALFSDVFSLGKEKLQFLRNSRSLLEEICLKIAEKDPETGFNLCRDINKPPNRSYGQNEMVQRDVDSNTRGGLSLPSDDMIYANVSLKKELKRKEELLAGLLFDFSLLQESTTNTKEIKDETEKLVCTLSQVRHELEAKTRKYDEMVVQYTKLECRLVDTEEALVMSNSDLAQSNDTIQTLSEQNAELRVLFKDMYLNKSDVEHQLEEHKELVKSLEEEILQMPSSMEKKFQLIVEGIEDNLTKVTSDRDQLKEEVQSLNDKLEIAYATIDEKEAIIIEARQESKASKEYAEQKEEEVRILEHSIQELDSTINVLEKKVYEMDDEVERHRLIRDSLELELEALRSRLLTVENLTELMDSDNSNAEDIQHLISRQLQSQDISFHEVHTQISFHEVHTQIKFLEEERTQQDNEIKQYKEYITELMLHAEAQSSQYKLKYKSLEEMVKEVKIDSTNSASTVQSLEKTEKKIIRARGSSSPFRCISSLVPQVNLETEQDLSAARLRIEELEALVAGQKKEVCLLKTRLAATESMTHDVIRDLLVVKLDMNNFADMIDQHQVKKLVEDAYQHAEAFVEKEEEVANLRKQINDLIEERESCILEMNRRDGDLLAAQIDVEQLQNRDRLLSAQNEMLKMDKSNLKKKIAELDEMVKALLRTKSMQECTQQTSSSSSRNSLKIGSVDFAKRLEQSEKLLSRVNGELAPYYKSSRDRTSGHGMGTSSRKHKGHVG